MNIITQSFHEGGPGMIPTAIFGLILVGVAIRYAFRPEKRYAPLLISLSIVTLFAGALGFTTGMIKTMTAMGSLEPPDMRIPMIGFGESLHNVALAIVLVLMAGLATAVGGVRIARAK